MTELAEVVDSRTDWLQELPAYQRNLLEQLAGERTLEEAAQAWLAASSPNTAGFSAVSSGKIFYDKIREQVHALLCDSSKYADERASLLRELGAGKTSFSASVAALMAPHLGTSGAMITPVIAVILTIASQMSVRAWCQMQAELRSQEPGTTATIE